MNARLILALSQFVTCVSTEISTEVSYNCNLHNTLTSTAHVVSLRRRHRRQSCQSLLRAIGGYVVAAIVAMMTKTAAVFAIIPRLSLLS